jgi:hypothetical protein
MFLPVFYKECEPSHGNKSCMNKMMILCESANEGYRFGQEEDTYNIVAAHGYFGRLISNMLVSTILVLYISS